VKLAITREKRIEEGFAERRTIFRVCVKRL